MKPPRRRRPGGALQPAEPSALDTLGALLARPRRGTFRLSPFLTGCYVHVDLEDPQLFPEMHEAARAVLELYAVVQLCGLAERRERLASAPTAGVTFGPLAAPYAPAFDRMAEVSEQLNQLASVCTTWPARGIVRADHNRAVLGDLIVQAASMSAALCAHCADASDVPADFAEARLNELENLFNT